jgi:hypothetical protein
MPSPDTPAVKPRTSAQTRKWFDDELSRAKPSDDKKSVSSAPLLPYHMQPRVTKNPNTSTFSRHERNVQMCK